MDPGESLTTPPVHEIWLAPRESHPVNSGKGTSDHPLRVAGPDEFDAVFRRPISVPTSYFLAPGHYATRGSWAFPSQGYAALGDGCRLVGSGSKHTQLALVDPVLETNGVKRRDTNILWAGPAYRHSRGLVVDGIWLNGNLSRQACDTVVGGLYIWGSEATVRDVKVTGLRGDYLAGMEVFGIATINAGDQPAAVVGGSTIEWCDVMDVAPGAYVSGISVGYRPRPRQMNVLPSVVWQCEVLGVADNHFAYAACHATRFEDCASSGTRYAFYNDTDGVDRLEIVYCRSRVSYAALYLVAEEIGAEKSNVLVQRCEFEFLPLDTASMIGLGVLDRRAVRNQWPARGIRVEDTSFQLERSNPFVLLSTDADDLGPVEFRRCSFPGGSLLVHSPKMKPRALLKACITGRQREPLLIDGWVGVGDSG